MFRSTRIWKLPIEMGLYGEPKTLQCTLTGAVDVLEGRVAVWPDFNRLEEWAYWNLMKFNEEK